MSSLPAQSFGENPSVLNLESFEQQSLVLAEYLAKSHLQGS